MRITSPGKLCSFIHLTVGFLLSFAIPLSEANLNSSSGSLPKQSLPGIDKSLIDFSIQPCDDFYQFACGNWLAQTEIPADQSAWDRSIMMLREKNTTLLRDILEKYAVGKLDNPKNPYAKKLGDYYFACMDEKKIEKNSLSELKGEFEKIDKLGHFKAQAKSPSETKDDPKAVSKTGANLEQLSRLLAQLHLKGVNAFFDFADQQDLKDASQMIGVVDQAGLGLPDRDYYLATDSKTLEVRNLYLKHIQKIMEFLGASTHEAAENAKKIIEIETYLAQNSLPRTDRRDPYKIYHRLDRAGLEKITPQVNWNSYWTESEVPGIQSINVTHPQFFEALNTLLSTIQLEDLKKYLKWRLASSMISALPKKFVDQEFQFISKALSGQKEIEPRWKRCVKAADQQMGFALSRSFVEVNYGREGKNLTKQMIEKVEKAFEGALKNLTWMDNETKKQALVKLQAIVNKVGYPDTWRNYDSFLVDRGSYFKTLSQGRVFNSNYHLAKIGKPVDRKDWEMTPSTVNAYYNPSLNEMVFPAGILQSPFFNVASTLDVNYGGIGMVMGHELTHGFDDEGRRFNAAGNLSEWWSPKVSKVFEERAKCVEKQYNAYESLPGLYLNGKLTLGENIADQGGIRLAYSAWADSKPSSLSSPSPSSSSPSGPSFEFSPEQRFFLSFAQSWCSKRQDQLARMMVKTDPHSPPKFRVNGSLSQFSKFAEAFQCKSGSPMAAKDPCVVW